MRRKAGHSMMRRAPSTPLSEGLPTWTVLMNRHEVRRRRPAHPRKPRDRTSRPESQASERHRSRSACSGTQHHPPCRSSDGQRPADRTMDATDTKARESRSRGCYQAALYNDIRTHRSLDKDAPVSRPVQRTGIIRSFPILGGLHHHYVRVWVFGTHSARACAGLVAGAPTMPRD